MKVLYDYQAFEMQTYGGVSRCFAELCNGLRQIGVECQVGVKESDNVYLKKMELTSDLFPLHYMHDKYYGSKQYFRGQWWAMRKVLSLFGHNSYYLDVNKEICIDLIKSGGFDVFHPTYFRPYFLPYLGAKPFVLTIHDMIPELFPQYFSGRNLQIEGRQVLAPKASAIIVVSERTKEDVVRLLRVPDKKVHVVYHGNSLIPNPNSSRPYAFKYILYVGGRYGYKDFDQFVTKITPVLERHQDLFVICTGSPFSSEEMSLFDSLGITERMKHHWAVSNDDLYALYHYAEGFVYSSEYEGFGIPILEAYASDCPVLLNNASCFPEIAGDAAVYFTFDTLADIVEQVLSYSNEEREALLIKQRARLGRYSWEKSARELLAVYESVV